MKGSLASFSIIDEHLSSKQWRDAAALTSKVSRGFVIQIFKASFAERHIGGGLP